MGCTSSISTPSAHPKKNMDETSTERINRIRRECRTRIKERVAEGGDAAEIEAEENEKARIEMAKVRKCESCGCNTCEWRLSVRSC